MRFKDSIRPKDGVLACRMRSCLGRDLREEVVNRVSGMFAKEGSAKNGSSESLAAKLASYAVKAFLSGIDFNYLCFSI